MSRVAICTDSSALFAPGVAGRFGLTVVPIGIFLDGEAYGSADADAFYSRLSAGASATTSLPSPGVFLDAYRAAAARGAENVLSVHVDARVSATVASAELAARESEIPVTVVDSGNVSYGLGACVSAAAAAVSAGASPAEAAREAVELGRTMKSIFVTASAPNGRVRAALGWAVLSFKEGIATPDTVYDSATTATEAMAARVLSDAGPRAAAVGHAASAVLPWADALAELLEGDPGTETVDRYRVTPPVGAHTGPLSFGAFWWPHDPG
jgi:DegV family protein with EDD domain